MVSKKNTKTKKKQVTNSKTQKENTTTQYRVAFDKDNNLNLEKLTHASQDSIQAVNRKILDAYAEQNKEKTTQNDVVEPEQVYTKPTCIYTKPDSYVLARAGLEIYSTDEENFQEYTSSENSETNDENENNTNTSNTSNSEDVGFSLHQGTITGIHYEGNLITADYEQDYTDMNNSGSVKLPVLDKNFAYKGVRVSLKRAWEKHEETLQWTDMNTVLSGFITEQSYSEDGVSLKISGMNKLLERNYKFKFTGLNRSKIIEEVIKCAGLTPMIDVTGLEDDIIDYTNIKDKTSGESNDNNYGEEAESIKEQTEKIIRNTTDDKRKMEKIYDWVSKNTEYSNHTCTRYDTPEKCLKNKNDLNCADNSRLMRAMMSSAGLNATVVHGDYHFWVVVTIDGKEYACDGTNSRGIGWVWIRSSGHAEQVSGGGPYYKKNGKNPEC